MERRIAIVTYAGGQSLDVVGPLEVFHTASALARHRRGARRGYRVEVLAERAGPVAMNSGLRLVADRAIGGSVRGIHTLLVAGGAPMRPDGFATPRLLAFLRRAAPRVQRLGAVCTGAFALAEAGLLNGRRATTHWASANLLAERFPRVRVEPDAIFVRHGRIYTSAGVTAGMDLALALVEADLGREIALAAARQLVMFLKRPGGQSQFSTQLAMQTRGGDSLEALGSWIFDHLDEDLSVAALAKRAAMSPRHFARVFRSEFGVTPAKFVEQARVERARILLEERALSLDEVASDCGFGSGERMRRSFLRQLRVPPADYRRRFESRRARAS